MSGYGHSCRHVRTSQNWIGGSRPGNALFVPPPADEVPGALASLDQWIHSEDLLAPLIRVGMAHVQFETIHPFLDGNGRIGRLLVALLVEQWGLLDSPLLYISLPLKRRQDEYYRRLASVRREGDWEAWLLFFLECVCEAALVKSGVLRETTGKKRDRVYAYHHYLAILTSDTELA